MKKVILCVSNDLTIDQRLHKVCESLLKNGYGPLLVGVQRKNSLPLVERAYRCRRLPLFFETGKFFYAELNIRLFIFLLFADCEIITSNDLDTIVPGYLVAFFRKKILVYDSHEYFTELPELQNKRLEKAIWTAVEKFIFPKLKRISTVGYLIAAEYQKKYQVPVSVIRNLPVKKETVITVSKEKKVIIYQGAVNVGRGIELMIDAMKFLPDEELWIIGQGPLLTQIKAYAEQAENVKVLGRKNFQELEEYTKKGFVGLSLEEDLGLNYRYALPNKLFDYVNAGLPVIVSDLPEMKKLVLQYNIGAVLKDRTPVKLAEMIMNFKENQLKYAEWVSNCRIASSELNWENQEHLLLDLYR